MTDLFLLQTNGGFLTQTNGGLIIIASTQGQGGASGGISKQVGVSLVKKQLGDKPFETVINHIKSKLLVSVEGTVTAPAPLKIPNMIHHTISKLVLKESYVTVSKLTKNQWGYDSRTPNKAWDNEPGKYVLSEICEMRASLKIDVSAPIESPLIRVEILEMYSPTPFLHPTSALLEYLKDSDQKKELFETKADKKKRLETLLELVKTIPVNQDNIPTGETVRRFSFNESTNNEQLIAFTHSSSFIGNVQYNTETLEMSMILNGKTYTFCNVSRRLYDSFEGSNSKGGFFNRIIKGLHDC